MEPAGDDFELLRRYAQERDEGAFAQLVRRYVNLVFSAAMRRTHDRHLAEDITQAVFVILAKKASRVCTGGGAMSAWLLKCVRYASANAIKMETRRQRHEESAGLAGSGAGAGACSGNPTDVLIWQEIAAQLDDAVLKLPALDRRAVLLRYFEDRPIGQIAAALNVTEGAAKQRLSRAIDRLRRRLSRHHGAMMSQIDAGALAGLLESHAVQAAPAGLGSAALAAATGGASAAGISIAKGAMTMMAWTKMKLAAALTAAIVIGGAGGVVAVKNSLAADKPASAAAQPLLTDAGLAVATPAPAAVQPLATEAAADEQVSIANAPPVVVKTVPEAGTANVDPSITEIKVTFSKPMRDGSWSWSTWGENTFPNMTGKPHYASDHRTCVAPVKLEPGHIYAIWLNSENFSNFRDATGHKAVPYLLVFETKK
jgi:RNA polymerase sigma factor (sigma-70 family)